MEQWWEKSGLLEDFAGLAEFFMTSSVDLKSAEMELCVTLEEVL